MVMLYCFMCFTDFVPDVRTRNKVGIVACLTAGSHLLVNLGIMFFGQLRTVWRNYKQKARNTNNRKLVVEARAKTDLHRMQRKQFKRMLKTALEESRQAEESKAAEGDLENGLRGDL